MASCFCCSFQSAHARILLLAQVSVCFKRPVEADDSTIKIAMWSEPNGERLGKKIR